MTQSKNLVLRIFATLAIGVSAALAAAFFLQILSTITDLREHQRLWIGALPFLGYLSASFYERYGGRSGEGFKLILDEVHRPQVVIPLRMAPFVMITTLASHLGGASVGREGTIVQMGASLAQQWARFWDLDSKERRQLLIAGASAGFAAAVGAPWAGFIFGLEVLQVGRLRWGGVWEALLAAIVASGTVHLLGFGRSEYGGVSLHDVWHWTLLPALLGLGLIVGVWARTFVTVTHIFEERIKRWLPDAKKRLLVIGFILVFAYAWEGSYRFAGLGIDWIKEAFHDVAPWSQSLYKFGFTVLSVGSGFKGGEFVPLVYMGSALGSALAPFLHLPIALAAALAFVAMFGAAANTPLTCTVLAMEMFGWQLGPLALIVCYVAYSLTPLQGIYKGQRMGRSKFHSLRRKRGI